MTSAEERLYALLPAIYRIRDAEQGEPLKALVSVIAEQVAVLDENLAQLYDDQFIETCAEWVAPYIGDLIGYRPLHGVVPRISSPRAEVAHTIGYRRRKGTAAMLEQLARDVTGWHARVVEFFKILQTTQYMNHIRRENCSPDLRRWEPLERLGTPFDTLAHTADVRRIATGRGCHNIPNVGVFLWRLNACSLTGAEPFKLDERRYLFSPLGNDAPLFTRPETEEEFAGLATRLNVPDPIGRRTLDEYFREYYGAQKSLLLEMRGKAVHPDQIVVCNLSDAGNGAWAHQPHKKIAIDPVLGRIAFPANTLAPTGVRVTFHYGFSSELGGGEYDRNKSVSDEFTRPDFQIGVSGKLAPVGGQLVGTLGEAVQAWNALPAGAVGVISIIDSGSYAADLTGADAIVMHENSRLLIVAADWPLADQPSGPKKRVAGRFDASGCRPHLRGHIAVNGTSGSGGQLFLNGVVVEGHLDVSGAALQTLSLRHCTFVPGRGLSRDSFPTSPREPSLVVTTSSASVEIDHSITGGVRVTGGVTTRIADSIVDAMSPCGVAFSAPDDHASGGTLHVENSTVIGKVHTVLMELATNTIFLSRLAAFDAWSAPVLCERRQAGCIRFSFVPLQSVTPRRYQCQPQGDEDAARVTPQFSSLRYGEPGYGQLSRRCAPEIFSGADDESEIGAFHELFEPQRITNVQVRLDEYLRFGLEAGIFFEPQLEKRALFPSAYGDRSVVDLCSSSADRHLGIGGGLI